MGWRKITKEDVRRGVLIRMTGIVDTPYNGATIVGVIDTMVWVSRPYVYAHEPFDAKSGLMGAENFPISIEIMCQNNTDTEVYEGVDGLLRTMLT